MPHQRLFAITSLSLIALVSVRIAHSDSKKRAQEDYLSSGIEVMLLLQSNQYHVGEPIKLSYGIRNASTARVLIPRELELVASPYGGFEIQFFDSSNSLVPLPNRSWSAAPSALRPISDRKDDFLLLQPSCFYGRTVIISNVPTKRGRYRVVARFNGPSELDSEKPKTTSNRDEVVHGTYDSNPIFISIK